MRLELPKVAYRQFEVRGYDKMIERILEAPLKSSKNSNNVELEKKLMLIKGQLKEQVEKGNKYMDELPTGAASKDAEERKLTDMDKYESEEEGDSSYESYYDDEEGDETAVTEKA